MNIKLISKVTKILPIVLFVLFMLLSQFYIGYILGKQLALYENKVITTFNGITTTILLSSSFFAGLLVMFLILINVNTKKVFEKLNEKMILFSGLYIVVASIMSMFLLRTIQNTDSIFISTSINLILGAVFILLSFVFRSGRKLQEEQDLTV